MINLDMSHKGTINYNLPHNVSEEFKDVIHKYKQLFISVPGQTSVCCHYISTESTPVKVPPRRIPAHYRAEVEK